MKQGDTISPHSEQFLAADTNFALNQILALINKLWDEFHHYQKAARGSEPPNKDLFKYLTEVQSNLHAAIAAYDKLAGVNTPNDAGGVLEAIATRTNALVRQIVTEPEEFATFLSALNSDLESIAVCAAPDTTDNGNETRR